MMIPTIHLNGTSEDDLIESVREPIHAVQNAIDVLAANGPNARDYYPQGPDAYGRARAEHEARMTVLRGLLDELHVLYFAIEDGGFKG